MSSKLPESGDFKPVVDASQSSKENVPIETPPTSYVGRTFKFLRDATNTVLHIFSGQVSAEGDSKTGESPLANRTISIKQQQDRSYPYGLGLGGETTDYDEIPEPAGMYWPVGFSPPESPSPRHTDTGSEGSVTDGELPDNFADTLGMTNSERSIGKLQKKVDALTSELARLKEENADLKAGDEAFDALLEEYVQLSNNLTSKVALLKEKCRDGKESFTRLLNEYLELSSLLGGEVSHLKDHLVQKEQAKVEVKVQPQKELEAPPPPSMDQSVIKGGAPPPPPPPPGMGPTASSKTAALTYPQARNLLKPVFEKSIGENMGVDSVKYLANSQNSEEIRRRMAESILREIFKDHKGVLDADIDEAVNSDANTTPKRNEGQVLRVLFNDILSKPAALLCASKCTPDGALVAEVAAKKEAKKELDISPMIPTVLLYLNSRGDPQSSITAMFEKKDPIPPLYGRVQFAVKDFCKTKLGYDEVKIKAVANDPIKLFAHFEQKLKEDAKATVVQLHSRGTTIPEEEKDIVYARALEKVSGYLDVRDPNTKTEILADPTKVLEAYREMSLLELALFDRGIDPKSLLQQKPSSISTELEKVKNKTITEKMKKDGKTDREDVSDYIYNMSHFLESYQDIRRDVSSIPTVDKRAKESYPYALSDKAFGDAIEKLKKGEFPKSLKLYFDDSIISSDKLLNDLCACFKNEADELVKRNILNALSPFQQLWLLEVAKGPERQFIAEFMANKAFTALQIGSTASVEAKGNALKLLAYIKENHAKAKPDQKEAYELFFFNIQKQKGFSRIKAYL